jgi:hypothetical protein
MTIRLPDPNIFDRFLKLLGKKRGVSIPVGACERFGPYYYAKASKESFWRALLRASSDELPDNLIDIFQIEDFRNEILESNKK